MIGAIYALLFPIAIVSFLCALATDIVYANSAIMMWSNFSAWLLFVGLVFGALAALALIIDMAVSRPIRSGIGWLHLVLFYVALIVELINEFVHSRDGWTSVVPTGLTLSIIGAILSLAAVATLLPLPMTWVGRREIVR